MQNLYTFAQFLFEDLALKAQSIGKNPLKEANQKISTIYIRLLKRIHMFY